MLNSSISVPKQLTDKMPRKKVTDVSGNGGVKKKRTSGKRKERDFSSDDEFDFEQENNKKPGKPAAKSGLQPVTVADDVKEKIVSRWIRGEKMTFGICRWSISLSFSQKLECPKVKGQLLIFGATNWDLIGRKEVPKQQGRFHFVIKVHRTFTVCSVGLNPRSRVVCRLVR